MFLETVTVYLENLAAVILHGLVSNWVYIILVELKFDSVAAQSFDVTKTALPMCTGNDTSQTWLHLVQTYQTSSQAMGEDNLLPLPPHTGVSKVG